MGRPQSASSCRVAARERPPHPEKRKTMNRVRQADHRSRRLRLGVRGMISAVAATGMAAAVAVGGFALAGLGNAGHARDAVSALDGALSHAQQLEYYNADVSGWQTAYAWDARRIGPVLAVQADNANRA